MKKVIIIIIIFGFLMVGLLTFQMVPAPTEKNTYTEEHKVEYIHSPCCLDIVFQLQGDKHINYINRGLELGIEPQEWNARLMNQPIRITFIKHKSLIGPKLRTIAKIEFENETLYNAIS